MKYFKILAVSFIALSLLNACTSSLPEEKVFENVAKVFSSKEDSLLSDVLAAHGSKNFEEKGFSFVFRTKTYSLQPSTNGYNYSKEFTLGDTLISDKLTSVGFTRTINGKEQSLDSSKVNRLQNSLNSVLYFATLPLKLQDESVHLKCLEQNEIKGISYDLLQVTFSEEDGGEDHEDQYVYWINTTTKLIDYFTYNYQVNGGGARFREAKNKQTVGGVVFQDYNNYKAPFELPLKNLGTLFEKGELEKLSEVNTESVEVL